VNLLKQKVADSATLISPRWDWEFRCFADGAQSKGVGGLIAHLFIDTGRVRERSRCTAKSWRHFNYSVRALAILHRQPVGSA
jgi:hypothetical protein